jgi:hypothetical protein
MELGLALGATENTQLRLKHIRLYDFVILRTEFILWQFMLLISVVYIVLT